MSYVIATPEIMTSAATDLATIGANANAAHMAASARTVAVLPAAAEEVSAGIAQQFSQHAQGYQALAGQAAAFHDQFVQALNASAFSYASIEAALASLLQKWQNLNVVADLFVSFISTTPRQQLLPILATLLTSPVWLPIAGILVLYYLYLLDTGQIKIMLPLGFLPISQTGLL